MAGLLHRLDRRLVSRWLQLSVQGTPPAAPQVIFAPNHLSHLDPFVLAAALERERMRRTFWAGWTGAAFRNPLTRAVSRLAQAIPVDERNPRSSLALAAAVLHRGYDLVWFPEGARSREGRLRPFRKGIGCLLEEYPVTVVPVAITGTYEVLPPGRVWPRARPVTLRFGAAVEPAELEREGRVGDKVGRITRALQARMERLLREG